MERVYWILALCSGASNAFGCGLGMQAPRNHFDGVNEWGFASHWEELGNVDFGNQLEFPLIINFRSDRVTSSPYLGAGWLLALVESRFVQVDERQFLMVQPNGTQTTFVRTKATDNVLKGGGEWLAKIEGNTITAWASCGWKMSFVRGKIATISTPKNRKIEYIYSGTRVTELRELGVPKLVLEPDPVSGFTRALLFNGKRIEIAIADRPRVQTLSGQNVVSGIDSSLSALFVPGAPKRRYEFAVNDQLQPTLKLSGTTDRIFTWDPSTKRIVSDNNWTYEIKPGATPDAFAELSRRNHEGKTELWYLDRAKGREIVKNAADDFTTVTTRFAGTGKLSGQLRKVERIEEGIVKIVHSTVYDENGQLQRESFADGMQKDYTYAKGVLHSIVTRSAERILTRVHVDDARRVTLRQEEGLPPHRFTYDGKGRVSEVFIDDVLHRKEVWSDDDGSVTQTVFANDGKTIARTFYSEFDHAGRKTLERITELSFSSAPETVIHSYDALGRIESRHSSNGGAETFAYLPNGEAVKTFLTNANTLSPTP